MNNLQNWESFATKQLVTGAIENLVIRLSERDIEMNIHDADIYDNEVDARETLRLFQDEYDRCK